MSVPPLLHTATAALAARGRHAALTEHSLAGMTNQYEDLFTRLVRKQ